VTPQAEPACTLLTSPLRVFDLAHAGNVSISQHWGENGSRTGGAVWDASLVLAHYLDAHHERWIGSSLLELGAGLGFASIVASRCGFDHVLATDGDPAVIPMAQQNVNDNDCERCSDIEVAHLEWGDELALAALLPPANQALLPDLIIASDIIYLGSTDSWQHLLTLITTLCRRRRTAHASPPPLTTSRPILTRHDGTTAAFGDPLVLLSHTRSTLERRIPSSGQRGEGTSVSSSFRLRPCTRIFAFRDNERSVLFELQWMGDALPVSRVGTE